MNHVTGCLSVYFVAFVAACTAALVEHDGGMHVFATLTNAAYFLPLIVTLRDRSATLHLYTGIDILIMLLGFGSMAHHARNCTNPNYRVLDLMPIHTLYTYMPALGLWLCFDHRGIHWRVIAGILGFVGIGVGVLFYETIVQDQDWFVVTMAMTSAALLFADEVLIHKTASCCAYGSYAALTVACFGTAFYANSAVSPWNDDDRTYSLLHGMWHIQVAAGQYLLVMALRSHSQQMRIDAGSALALTAMCAFVVLIVWQRVSDYAWVIGASGIGTAAFLTRATNCVSLQLGGEA